MEKNDIWSLIGKVLVIVALVIASIRFTMNFMQNRLEQREEQPSSNSSTRKEENVTIITILSAGNAEFGYRVENQEDYWDNVSAIAEIVANYDIAVYNQKAVIGSEIPWQFAQAMVGTGFNMVGLATPQAMRYGKEGIVHSMDFFEGSPAITSGTHVSTDHCNLIPMMQFEDISVAFLSFTETIEDEIPPQEQYLVNIYDDETSIAQIEKAASQADVVIVSMDWQAEEASPSPRQKEIAKKMADAGASVIIGHSNQGIQPVAWIDDTLIFYSTGALISDSYEEKERLGILGAVTITKTTLGERKRVELTNPCVEIITSKKWGSSYQIQLLEQGETCQNIVELIQQLDDSIRVGGLL